LVWGLVDEPAALAWLAHNPELPDPQPDDEGVPCPSAPSRPNHIPRSRDTRTIPTQAQTPIGPQPMGARHPGKD
jgi:hypothetical protein